MSAKHIFLARFISRILLVVLLVNIDGVGLSQTRRSRSATPL
jgi:hypothetical protein